MRNREEKNQNFILKPLLKCLCLFFYSLGFLEFALTEVSFVDLAMVALNFLLFLFFKDFHEGPLIGGGGDEESGSLEVEQQHEMSHEQHFNRVDQSVYLDPDTDSSLSGNTLCTKIWATVEKLTNSVRVN